MQSAGAGGAGALLVNGVAAGTATAAAVAATAPRLIKAIKEGKQKATAENITCKHEDKDVEEHKALEEEEDGSATEKGEDGSAAEEKNVPAVEKD